MRVSFLEVKGCGVGAEKERTCAIIPEEFTRDGIEHIALIANTDGHKIAYHESVVEDLEREYPLASASIHIFIGTNSPEQDKACVGSKVRCRGDMCHDAVLVATGHSFPDALSVLVVSGNRIEVVSEFPVRVYSDREDFVEEPSRKPVVSLVVREDSLCGDFPSVCMGWIVEEDAGVDVLCARGFEIGDGDNLLLTDVFYAFGGEVVADGAGTSR